MEKFWSRFRKATTVMIAFKLISLISQAYNLWNSNRPEVIEELEKILPGMDFAPSLWDNIQGVIAILVTGLILILAWKARREITNEQMPNLLAYYLSFVFAGYNTVSAILKLTLNGDQGIGASLAGDQLATGIAVGIGAIILLQLLLLLPEIIAYRSARKIQAVQRQEGLGHDEA